MIRKTSKVSPLQPKIFVDPARSATMRAVKSADTRPELLVRSVAHRLGFRFRLHSKALPGCPDLVFARRRKAIFVNGCFWHGHDCPRGARTPKTNVIYWQTKIANNRRRDASAQADLAAAGWAVLVVWECETRRLETVRTRLLDFLS
jgi:DNA mismatch endonuclease (patch repair protein)